MKNNFAKVPTYDFDEVPTNIFDRVPTSYFIPCFDKVPTYVFLIEFLQVILIEFLHMFFDRVPTSDFDRVPTSYFDKVPTQKKKHPKHPSILLTDSFINNCSDMCQVIAINELNVIVYKKL